MRHHAVFKNISWKAVPLKAVLLAFQLVLGLQLQAAQVAMAGMPMPTAMRMGTTAAAEPMAMHVGTTGSEAQPGCPAHSTAHNIARGAPMVTHHSPRGASTGTHDSSRGASTGTHDSPRDAPMGTRDCCHAGACQCHCVYTPGAIALPVLANIATSIAISSLASTQFVAPRIDEFLRPPIV